MARKKRQVAEFRYYKMSDNCALFALLGERWRQKYERDIDFLHFHNYLEIGYCYLRRQRDHDAGRKGVFLFRE